MSPLEEIRSLIHVRDLLECELSRAARRAVAEGVDRSALAHALGISRASVYRHFQPLSEVDLDAGNESDAEVPGAGSDAEGVLRLAGERRRTCTGASSQLEPT